MKGKKLALLLTFLLILTLALAACGGGDTGGDTAGDTGGDTGGDTPTEKVKVRIFVGLGTGTDPDQIAGQEAIADKFNATHDDIEIEFMIVPNEEANERLVAMMSGVESIRDVIAFPKTQKASCLLTQAPSEVDDLQLRDLGIKRRNPKPAT